MYKAGGASRPRPYTVRMTSRTLAAVLCFVILGFSSAVWVANAQTTTTNQATGTVDLPAAAENRPEPTATTGVPTRPPATPGRPNAETIDGPVLPAAIQKRVINLAANMSNRIDAAAARLTHIADRLDSRLKKLAATGVNVTAAREQLARATDTLDAVAASMANIDTAVYTSVTSPEPRVAWQQVRSHFQKNHAALQSSKTQLQNAVASAKAAIRAAETGAAVGSSAATEAATSSATTTVD